MVESERKSVSAKSNLDSNNVTPAFIKSSNSNKKGVDGEAIISKLLVKLPDEYHVLKDVIYSFQGASTEDLEASGTPHDYIDVVDNLSENAQISLTWVRPPGVETPIPTNLAYQFFRNQVHTVNINLNSGTTPTLNEEETPMGDGPNYEL